MDLSDFKIQQVVFEVRYEEAFILWDVAGRVHRELARLWPGVTLEKSEPNQQFLKGDSAEIHTGIKQSRVALLGPPSITKFNDQLTETFAIWTTLLEVTRLTRVGTRVIFARKFPSIDAASKAVIDLGLIRYPPPPIFNHKTPPYGAQVNIVWQDEEAQTRFVAKAEHQTMEIAVIDAPGAKETRTSDTMVIDIDRATRGTVELSKLRVAHWMEGVRHVIARDVPRLLKQA
jgi:hypothetical protein